MFFEINIGEIPEAYLEPNLTYSVKLFAKTINNWKHLDGFAKGCIINVLLGSKNTSGFSDIYMEIFNKAFSWSWIFSPFWACKKAAFVQVNSFSSYSCTKNVRELSLAL